MLSTLWRERDEARQIVPTVHDSHIPVSICQVTQAFAQAARKRKANHAIINSLEYDIFARSPHKLFIVTISQAKRNSRSNALRFISPSACQTAALREVLDLLAHDTMKESSHNESCMFTSKDNPCRNVCNTEPPPTDGHVKGTSDVQTELMLTSLVNTELQEAQSGNLECVLEPTDDMVLVYESLQASAQCSCIDCVVPYNTQQISLPVMSSHHVTNVDECESSEHEYDFIYRVLLPEEKIQGVSLQDELAMSVGEPHPQEKDEVHGALHFLSKRDSAGTKETMHVDLDNGWESAMLRRTCGELEGVEGSLDICSFFLQTTNSQDLGFLQACAEIFHNCKRIYDACVKIDGTSQAWACHTKLSDTVNLGAVEVIPKVQYAKFVRQSRATLSCVQCGKRLSNLFKDKSDTENALIMTSVAWWAAITDLVKTPNCLYAKKRTCHQVEYSLRELEKMRCMSPATNLMLYCRHGHTDPHRSAQRNADTKSDQTQWNLSPVEPVTGNTSETLQATHAPGHRGDMLAQLSWSGSKKKMSCQCCTVNRAFSASCNNSPDVFNESCSLSLSLVETFYFNKAKPFTVPTGASGHLIVNIPHRTFQHPVERSRCLLTQNNNSLPGAKDLDIRGSEGAEWDVNANYSSDEDYSLTYTYSQKNAPSSRGNSVLLRSISRNRGGVKSVKSGRHFPSTEQVNKTGEEANPASLRPSSTHSTNCRCLEFDCLRRRGEMLHEHIMQNLHLLKSFATNEPRRKDSSYSVHIKETIGRNTVQCLMEGNPLYPRLRILSRYASSKKDRASPFSYKEVSAKDDETVESQSISQLCAVAHSDGCPQRNNKICSPPVRDETKPSPSQQSVSSSSRGKIKGDKERGSQTVSVTRSVRSDTSEQRGVEQLSNPTSKTAHDVSANDKFVRLLRRERPEYQTCKSQNNSEDLDALVEHLDGGKRTRSCIQHSGTLKAPSPRPAHISASIRHNKTCLRDTCTCKIWSARSLGSALGRSEQNNSFDPRSFPYQKRTLSAGTFSLESSDECPFHTSRSSADSSRRRRSFRLKKDLWRPHPALKYTELETKEVITRPTKKNGNRQIEKHEFRTTGDDATSYFYSYLREHLPKKQNSSDSKAQENAVVGLQADITPDTLIQSDKQKSPRLISSETQVMPSDNDETVYEKETQTSRSLETFATDQSVSVTTDIPIDEATPSSQSENIDPQQIRPMYKGILIKSKSPERDRAVRLESAPDSHNSTKTTDRKYLARKISTHAPPNKNPNHSISTPFSSRMSLKVDPAGQQLALTGRCSGSYTTPFQGTVQTDDTVKITSTDHTAGQFTSFSRNSISQSTDSNGVSWQSYTQISNCTANSTERSASTSSKIEISAPQVKNFLGSTLNPLSDNVDLNLNPLSDNVDLNLSRPADVVPVVHIPASSHCPIQPTTLIQHYTSSPFSPVLVTSPVSPVNISSSPFSPIHESSCSLSPTQPPLRPARTLSPVQSSSITPSTIYQSNPSSVRNYLTVSVISDSTSIPNAAFSLNRSSSRTHQSARSHYTLELNRLPSPTPASSRSPSPNSAFNRTPSATRTSNPSPSQSRVSNHSSPVCLTPSPTQLPFPCHDFTLPVAEDASSLSSSVKQKQSAVFFLLPKSSHYTSSQDAPQSSSKRALQENVLHEPLMEVSYNSHNSREPSTPSTRTSSPLFCYDTFPQPPVDKCDRNPTLPTLRVTASAGRPQTLVANNGVIRLASFIPSLARLGDSLGRSARKLVTVVLSIILLSGGLAFGNRCDLAHMFWDTSLRLERILEDMMKHMELRHVDIPPQ